LVIVFKYKIKFNYSNSSLCSIILTLSSGSFIVLISACIPNLSNNCGLSSPSSGFPDPISINLDEWVIEFLLFQLCLF